MSAVYTRRSRVTGTSLTVGRAKDLGLDPEGGAWVTICDDHGTIANSDTRALATVSTSLDFCDFCRDTIPTRKVGSSPCVSCNTRVTLNT